MHVLLKTVQLDLMDLLIEDYRPRILLCHTIFRSVAAPFNPYQFLRCNVILKVARQIKLEDTIE